MIEITAEDLKEIENNNRYPATDGLGWIMSNEEYHKDKAIGSTSLKFLEESAIHFEKRKLFDFESESLNLGSMVHTLTLEPEKFDEEYRIEPQNAPRNTKIGKAKWDEHEELLNGRISVSKKDFEIAEKMARNLRETILSPFLDGVKERSFFADIQGVKAKCRPDLLVYMGGTPWLFDVKTTRDINKLSRVIEDYRYDRAMAWYRRVLAYNGIEIKGCVLAFVSNQKPYFTKAVTIANEDLDNADFEIDDMIAKYKDFKATGVVTDLIKPIEIFKWNK
jgi:exodeoxyribonuclease VIII